MTKNKSLQENLLAMCNYVADGDVSYEMSGYAVMCSECLTIMDHAEHQPDCIVGKAEKIIEELTKGT